MFRLYATILLAALMSFATSSKAADENTAKAAADSAGPKLVKIMHVASGKVLGTEEDTEDAGTSAKIVKDAEKDKENTARQWKIVKAGSFYKIANAKSNHVLDVSNESTDEDGSIIIWDDKPDADGNDNQRWSFSPKLEAKESKSEGDAKTGEVETPRRIRSKSSNLVLDVDDQGMVVQRRPDEKAKSQLWLIVEIKPAKAEK